MKRGRSTGWLEGPGLHTGAHCRARVTRGPKGLGIIFHTPNGEISATPQHIDQDAHRTTALTRGSARIGMVEHFLAAAGSLGLCDLIVDSEGPELPALDGASLSWWDHLSPLSDSNLTFFTLDAPLQFTLGDSKAVLSPLEEGAWPAVRVAIEFPIPSIGRMQFTYEPLTMDFKLHVAPARTFAMLDEVRDLQSRGLARGGSLENAIVFDNQGPVNPDGLRFPDEAARHKLLDAMGDFMLIGGWPWATVDLWRPSHKLLHEIARRVQPRSFNSMVNTAAPTV